MLLDLVTLAAAGRIDEYTTRLSQIEQKHMDTIEVSNLLATVPVLLPQSELHCTRVRVRNPP